MPSKDMSQNYAPAAWGSRDFEFEIPSGGTCLLRKMDPLALIETGLMDKLDFATNVVMNTHVKNAGRSKIEQVKADRAKREGKPPPAEDDTVALQTLIDNPDQLLAFRDVLDQVLLLGVVAPKMHLPPEDDADRVDGVFYTDSVPFNDKLAVFNKLMEGVRVIEQFRSGSEEVVGDVASQPVVRAAPKRPARAPRQRSAG